MRPTVKALGLGCLTVIVAAGVTLMAGPLGRAGASAQSANGECVKRTINWAGKLKVRAPTRLLVSAEIRWVRLCGQQWTASGTITNIWSKPLWWSHGLSLQPRFSRKHPQEQLLPRSNASMFRPAPPHVLKSHQAWVGTFGGTSLPLGGDELHFTIALFSNAALHCNCLGFGFESPWFPRQR